jgi:hypothetical protein
VGPNPPVAGPARTVPPAMPTVALVTPSHRRDLARCELLCETVDRHVTGFERHYLIVNDGDVRAFRHLAGPTRTVIPTRRVLPWWLQVVPLLTWRGRKVFVSARSRPLRGWHVQQLVKLSAASTLAHDAVVILDSDISFVRPFDAAAVAETPTPLHHDPAAVTVDTVDHAAWLATAYRLLGVAAPPLPDDDYIDSIVTWRTDTVRDLLARIEATTGQDWMVALARSRDYAEFMLYGLHVATDDTAGALHRFTTESFSRSYWGGEALDADAVRALLAAVEPPEVAIHVQGWGDTPLELIRSALLHG